MFLKCELSIKEHCFLPSKFTSIQFINCKTLTRELKSIPLQCTGKSHLLIYIGLQYEGNPDYLDLVQCVFKVTKYSITPKTIIAKKKNKPNRDILLFYNISILFSIFFKQWCLKLELEQAEEEVEEFIILKTNIKIRIRIKAVIVPELTILLKVSFQVKIICILISSPSD